MCASENQLASRFRKISSEREGLGRLVMLPLEHELTVWIERDADAANREAARAQANIRRQSPAVRGLAIPIIDNPSHRSHNVEHAGWRAAKRRRDGSMRYGLCVQR